MNRNDFITNKISKSPTHLPPIHRIDVGDVIEFQGATFVLMNCSMEQDYNGYGLYPGLRLKIEARATDFFMHKTPYL